MRFRRTLCIILPALTFIACAGSEPLSRRGPPQYLVLAEEILGSGAACTADSSGRYVLCLRSDRFPEPPPDHRFHLVVIHVRTNQVVLEDTAPDGSAVWLDDLRIQVNTFPRTTNGEMGQRPAPSGYVYDVQARTRTLQIPAPPR